MVASMHRSPSRRHHHQSIFSVLWKINIEVNMGRASAHFTLLIDGMMSDISITAHRTDEPRVAWAARTHSIAIDSHQIHIAGTNRVNETNHILANWVDSRNAIKTAAHIAHSQMFMIIFKVALLSFQFNVFCAACVMPFTVVPMRHKWHEIDAPTCKDRTSHLFVLALDTVALWKCCF